MRPVAIIGLLVGAILLTGCVRRTITITSEPTGALCWLNGREVGRTPVTVDFLFYGTYDVRLTAEDCEPLLTSGKADAPLWDSIPFDFFSEMTPGERKSEIIWHFSLQPRNDDPAALIERARELRDRLAPPGSEPAPAPQPETNIPAEMPPVPPPASAPATVPAE